MPNVEPPATAGRNIGLAAPRAEQGNVLFAAAWMMGALASFAAMAIAGREISRELDTFQLMFFRSMIGFSICSVPWLVIFEFAFPTFFPISRPKSP